MFKSIVSLNLNNECEVKRTAKVLRIFSVANKSMKLVNTQLSNVDSSTLAVHKHFELDLVTKTPTYPIN